MTIRKFFKKLHSLVTLEFISPAEDISKAVLFDELSKAFERERKLRNEVYALTLEVASLKEQLAQRQHD